MKIRTEKLNYKSSYQQQFFYFSVLEAPFLLVLPFEKELGGRELEDRGRIGIETEYFINLCITLPTAWCSVPPTPLK